jgi:hypothetical protein
LPKAAGKSCQDFLSEVASHGFIVIANGSLSNSSDGLSQTNVKWLSQILDWAVKADGGGQN